jgi:hypothetical protein
VEAEAFMVGLWCNVMEAFFLVVVKAEIMGLGRILHFGTTNFTNWTNLASSFARGYGGQVC